MQDTKIRATGFHYLLQANVFVSREEFEIKTILGSCVAVCLYDPILKSGGMNHFLVPVWNGSGLESPMYGNIAIEMLIRKMEKNGSNRKNLVAKIFGGASQFDTRSSLLNVGEKNSTIARSMLEKEHIRIVGSSVGGNQGRKIIFNTFTGTVMMKYIVKNEGRDG